MILAHAVAFGSGYVLGASNASFLLVLAVHHEVQYLYFTYAMSRRSAVVAGASRHEVPRSEAFLFNCFIETQMMSRSEVKHAAAFSCLAGDRFCRSRRRWLVDLPWLAPLGTGGLFCHYWLDGRIWTRKSFQS